MPWHSFQPELYHLSFSVIATKRRNETIKPKATQFNLRLRDILRLFKSIPSMTASDTKVIEEFFSVATKVAHFEWRPSPRKELSISKYAMENQMTPHSWMLTWSTKYTYFPLDRMLVHSRLLPEFRQFSKYFADSLLHFALRKIQSNLNVNDCTVDTKKHSLFVASNDLKSEKLPTRTLTCPVFCSWGFSGGDASSSLFLSASASLSIIRTASCRTMSGSIRGLKVTWTRQR